MDSIAIGLILFGAMLLLMIFRMPISMAMFVPGAIAFSLMTDFNALLNHLKAHTFARLSIYDLSVIPLFILMGQIATQGGLSKSLFLAANTILGHMRGGMATSSIAACALFGSICGSSVATTATMAQVAMPQMKNFGYSGRLSTASLAAGGTLGILIPPSVPLVIYAILTEQNIAKLFVAAIIPAIIAFLGYCITVNIYSRLRPQDCPAQKNTSLLEKIKATMSIWPIVTIFSVVLGGIYSGIFTPTEGAAVGTLITFVISIVKRDLSIRGLRASILGTATTTGMIFFIFIGADMLNSALALSQMPADMARSITSLGWSPITILSCIIIFYIVMGFFMDELSVIILTIPVVFPTIMGLDFWGLTEVDKAIWFGILVLTVVGVGLISPPVGLNIYVVNSLAKNVKINEIYRGIFPFLISDSIRILILLIFPSISLFLVHRIF